MKKVIASLLVVLIISLGYCSSTPEETTPMPVEEPAKTEPAKDAKTPAKTPAKAPAKK